MNDFSNVPVYTGKHDYEMSSPVPAPLSATSSVEQSRAVAETQAAMVVAQRFPRDETASVLRITKACQRYNFAKSASYSYPRGKETVKGPSIRLAEAIAREWGNLFYGFRELSRSGDSSEVEAYCWDLQTNTKVVRTFAVKHYRDKKTGNEALTSERDKYELVANMAQRRVRACILEIIPGDIVETALEDCEKTKRKGDKSKTIEDRIRDMAKAFDSLGVSIEMIEGRLKHDINITTNEELAELHGIYTSMRDGMAKREDFFSVKTEAPKNEPTPEPKEKIKEPKKSAPQPTPEQMSDHDKACARLSELSEANKKLVEKHLAGRNPDHMTVEELEGVIDGVEDEMK